MAIVHHQQVPASLLDDYERIMVSVEPNTPSSQVARIDPKARRPDLEPRAGRAARFAMQAATWLRDRWKTATDKAARSAFYRDRKTEILNGVFPAQHWHPTTITEDLTEYSVPTVSAYYETWNPAYFDPQRQASTCKYRDVTRFYPTPSGNGTETDPAPGWKGEVISNVWRDLYHAQRRFTFALPITVSKDDGRPIALWITAEITATATIRGNRNWFVLIVSPLYHQSNNTPGLEKEAKTHWAREDAYPYGVPDDDPDGWNHTVRRTSVYDGRRFARWSPNSNRLTLRLSTPPSLGFYGSRNDSVTVYHHATVQAFIAKSP